MFLTILLEKAINDLSTLRDYYDVQIEFIEKRVEKESEKYKYSIALEKFFFRKIMERENEDILDELDELTEEENELLEAAIDTYEILDKDDGVGISYKLKEEIEKLSDRYELFPNRGHREYRKLQEQPHILGKTTLMMLLVNYEEVIAGIFKHLLSKYPMAYLTSKTVTYAELMTLEVGVNDIKRYFIDNEIDALMRMPLSDWYKMFETKHKAEFLFENDEFEIFKEIYYRRNILVHNNGIVNKIYMDNVAEKYRKNIALGDELQATPDYIRRAMDVTHMILYETFWGLRKVSDNRERLEEKLFDIGFAHMMDQKWELSEFIYKNLKDEKEQENATKMVNLVNYWISLKNKGQFDKIKDDIIKFDVSAMSGQFQVAKYALLDEYDKVSKGLEEILEKEIPAHMVESWPLFIQYRESKEYQEFREIHSDLFQIKEYDPEDIEIEQNDEIIEKE